MITNPTPQRALRGHRHDQDRRRVRSTAEHHAWLAGHLTARDRWLVRMLFEHKVFTTHQIVGLAFPTQRAANFRLLNLYKWGVVHRFQPHREIGSHPMHYVLDTAGATLLAHEEGVDLRALNYSRDREIGRAYSLQLAHTVGCNGLFTTLIRRARRGDTGKLTAWWSAARCGQHWGDIITADGYGRWREHGHDTEWFIEFDFGTEQLARLAAKLTRYERLATTTGITTPILIWLPTPEREATVRRALAHTLHGLDHPSRVPVATTNAAASPDALDIAEPRWRPLGDPSCPGRVSLSALHHIWPDLSTLTAPASDTDRDRTPADNHLVVAPPPPMPPPEPTYRRR